MMSGSGSVGSDVSVVSVSPGVAGDGDRDVVVVRRRCSAADRTIGKMRRSSRKRQNLDIASRVGLDPNVQRHGVPHRRLDRRRGRHLQLHACSAAAGSLPTRPGCARTSPPSRCRSSARVTCNRAIFPQLRAALEEIVAAGPGRRDPPGEYAGCYYPRFIAGSTTLSNHSFGLALDLNVPGNQRGTVGEMDRASSTLQGVGLRLGRRLELHRPDALRDGAAGRPALRSGPASAPVVFADMRAVQVIAPTRPRRGTRRRRRRARRPVPTRSWSRSTASASGSPTSC